MPDSRLSKRVEVKIKQLIAEGHLKIGDRLPPERELAEAMNVSRHTLREAIKTMEINGLLKIRPGSGTFIFRDHDLPTQPKGPPSIFSDYTQMPGTFPVLRALDAAL